MPTVQPAELWQESGRWKFYGKELLRFRDRKAKAESPSAASETPTNGTSTTSAWDPPTRK